MLRSCLTLFDCMDYSPPGFSLHGILQARMLEWVAMPFSRWSFQPRDQTQVTCTAGRFFTIWATSSVQLLSRVRLCDPMNYSTPGFPVYHQLRELAHTHVQVGDAITISSSVVPISFCLQSFPASGSFPISKFSVSGGQSIGTSTSVLPMNIQDWFSLGLTGLISLQSKGLSRVFSNTAAWEAPKN